MESETKLDNLLDKLDKFHADFYAHTLQDTQNLSTLKLDIQLLRAAFEESSGMLKTFMSTSEPRLRRLEDFNLKLVTKIATWFSIALFGGTLVSQVALSFITKLWIK